MKKSRPNWSVWKHIPEVNANQAVALTLNVEPGSISRTTSKSIVGFTDRLFLFESCFGTNRTISLPELAKWAQSVEWNIPVELATFSPMPAVVYQAAPVDSVDLAIASILAPGADGKQLQNALESEGCRFIMANAAPAIYIEDGTTKGALHAIKEIYLVASNIYSRTGNAQIGSLMRGSGASGGGAMQSTYSSRTDPTIAALISAAEPEPEPEPEPDDTSMPPESAESIASSPPTFTCALSELFDLVAVAQLEKMFPAPGKWKKWAERAAGNGLAAARDARAMFNPYRAAMWFLKQGPEGWDMARCHRVLANNLPARSKDKAHLLIDEKKE